MTHDEHKQAAQIKTKGDVKIAKKKNKERVVIEESAMNGNGNVWTVEKVTVWKIEEEERQDVDKGELRYSSEVLTLTKTQAEKYLTYGGGICSGI